MVWKNSYQKHAPIKKLFRGFFVRDLICLAIAFIVQMIVYVIGPMIGIFLFFFLIAWTANRLIFGF